MVYYNEDYCNSPSLMINGIIWPKMMWCDHEYYNEYIIPLLIMNIMMNNNITFLCFCQYYDE